MLVSEQDMCHKIRTKNRLVLLSFPLIIYGTNIAFKRKDENFLGEISMKIRYYLTVVLAVCLVPVNNLALNPNVSEWELKVLVENANIRTEPDERSPVVTTVAKGSMLESYARKGAWFRVIITSEKDGFMSLGYIHFNDVEVIREELSEETDFWEYEDPGTFQGIGLSVKVTGGMNYFSGGDVGVGTRGIYDTNSNYLASQGFALEHFLEPFHYGAEISGDIVFNFNPKFGIGIGSGYINATSQSVLTYRTAESLLFQMKSQPEIRVTPLRVGMFFSIPLLRVFTVTINAGPELYFAQYRFTMGSEGDEIATVYHNASAKRLGFQGGLGIEINLNQRAIFLIECHGRYAKINNFQGKATINDWELMINNMISDNITTEEGTLYFLKRQTHPGLVISQEKPVGYENIRTAVLDLSGFTLRAGLKFRF